MKSCDSISVLFLTCQRLEYIAQTFEAIRLHFAEVETHIKPVWLCFDNGSPESVRKHLSRMPFDVLLLSRENIGIGPAMNQLLSAVRTTYVLNLQDDWLLENPRRLPFVDICTKVLESDARFGQAKLDTAHFLDFNDKQIYDGPFKFATQDLSFYAQNPNMLWGGMTFPPAITKTSAIREIGPFLESQPFRRGWAESEYSARSSKTHFCIKSPELLLFKHIGDIASPGWTRKPQSAAAQSVEQPTKAVASPPMIISYNSRPKKDSVACLVTSFKRPQNIRRQYDALQSQSWKPTQCSIWKNFSVDSQEDPVLDILPNVSSTNMNWGVWPRFLMCQEFDAEYVCVFDDDTIPGTNWLENCLETMRSSEGLLGTIGVVFPNLTRAQQYKVGWPNPNATTVEVDIVGHSWFFKREWLRFFALEPRLGTPTCGEDYHFSVSLQKHLGLGTYVPPHDPTDKRGWGSIHGELGNDQVALYLQPEESDKKQLTHDAYLASGWRPLAARSRELQNSLVTEKPITRNVGLITFEQDFVKDFEKFDLNGQPFAFARFGDGELAVCTGRPIRVSDGWQYNGENSKFAVQLRDAITADIPGYCLGISCRCCDPRGYGWYSKNVRAPLSRVTFANIFVNGNYNRFRKLDLSNTVLVSCVGGDFSVPRDAINSDFDIDILVEKLLAVDRPILVAAGPLACILIHKYWLRARTPQIIWDIGSALDPILLGKKTRSYHDMNSPNARKRCVW